MSEAILVILILLTLLATFCLYKMLDKRGLYFSVVMVSIISFVFTFKIAYLLKLNVNIGIIPLTGFMNIIYMFILKYGSDEKKNLINITLYSNIITAILLAIMNYYVPAITETISINMQGTFEYNYKILIVYPIILTLSEYLTIKLFNLVSQIQNNIIISGVLTYIIIGLIYTVGMYLLIYINIIETKYSLFLGISSYILGLLLTLFNTIILNIMNYKKVI